MWPAVLVFAATYVAMAGAPVPFVRVDRPTAALCGAVAMVLVGALTLEQALAAVDLHVVALLLGVMIIAGYLREARFFRRTAWWVLTRARTAQTLLWLLVFVAGGLSAVLVNDTICLMFTPLVAAVVAEAQLPALPYLIALASASNIGGVVSFTGNPQNMLIGAAARGQLSYLEYLVRALPIGALCLAADAVLIGWIFRHELPRGPLPARAPEAPDVDRVLAGKALGALAVFVAAALAGVSLAGAAMTAAALLVLVARKPPRTALANVDWPLLFFFAGLFVVVRGLAASGALAGALDRIAPALAHQGVGADTAFASVTAVGSNVVSNVPFVMVALAGVSHSADPRHGYVLLAVASTLAGNLTLFGSVANIIVFEGAGPRGEVGFWRFARVGAVITVATMAIALAVLWAWRAVGG